MSDSDHDGDRYINQYPDGHVDEHRDRNGDEYIDSDSDDMRNAGKFGHYF